MDGSQKAEIRFGFNDYGDAVWTVDIGEGPDVATGRGPTLADACWEAQMAERARLEAKR